MERGLPLPVQFNQLSTSGQRSRRGHAFECAQTLTCRHAFVRARSHTHTNTHLQREREKERERETEREIEREREREREREVDGG